MRHGTTGKQVVREVSRLRLKAWITCVWLRSVKKAPTDVRKKMAMSGMVMNNNSGKASSFQDSESFWLNQSV